MGEMNLSPGAAMACQRRRPSKRLIPPHGNEVIYPALVRLGFDFSMRYSWWTLRELRSIDGVSPAAMQYTEAKFQPL